MYAVSKHISIRSVCLTLLVLLLLMENTVHAQQIKKEASNHLLIGVNLMTPLGSMTDGNFRPVSFVSSNPCVSISAAYRRGQFGIKMPVRIPLKETKAPEESYSWFSRSAATNYEVGILPAFYFHRPDEFFQAYTYFGMFFGNAYAFKEISYDHYSYDAGTGTYSNYESFTTNFEKTHNWSYYRVAFGTGIQLQWDSGLGLRPDLNVFLGRNQMQSYIRYTNSGTTDGVFYLDFQNENQFRIWGVQFGLSLTYRIF